MATQNRKFTTVLLAGLFIGGAVALGYACGGDDTSGPAVMTPTNGAPAATSVPGAPTAESNLRCAKRAVLSTTPKPKRCSRPMVEFPLCKQRLVEKESF
jgi:hypothetical protein